jgi:thiamine kinase-like enzyme
LPSRALLSLATGRRILDAEAMPDEPEILLTGGSLSVGVARVGNTVRRPVKASSEFVARLLRYLEERSVSWAPRYLGRDERGRDSLTFMVGTVPAKWLEQTNAQITAAAQLLRSLHDATRGSELAGEHAVVCHNDPSPSNTVFDNRALPIAFIDFDFAAPGDPLEDLGYLAWSWCVSSKPTRAAAAAQAAQVRVAADAYEANVTQRAALVDAMLERLTRNRALWFEQLALGAVSNVPPERMLARIAWSEAEFAFVTEHRATFEAALACP